MTDIQSGFSHICWKIIYLWRYIMNDRQIVENIVREIAASCSGAES